ncbi:Z1 domain-containing protein [Clostridium saudiense]|uniref:Z1 domain-containing protein n=1 Tax=Clostridium saudiense TaxID=1414720 RepID=UPI0018ABE82D|nr:Z1 domain-containing protein [Clostridium saudiense]
MAININMLLANELENIKKSNGDRIVLSDDEVNKIIDTVIEQKSFLDRVSIEEIIENNSNIKAEMKEYCLKQCYVTSEYGEQLKENSKWNKVDWVNQWRDKFTRFSAFKENIKFLPQSVIDTIDRDSNKILNNIPEPRKYNEFEVIGLVDGLVQMGKTTNMCAVINKAIDVGYDIIIIFTGITKDLRDQGQKRVENDCYGFDSITNERIGIGKILFDIGIKLITRQDEFGENGKIIDGDIGNEFSKYVVYKSGEKYVFVCKRNTTVINRLIKWVKRQRFYNKELGKVDKVSLLIIQDECDQALVNTQPEGKEPAATNRALRNLFKLFTKKVSIGYTATPFSNIYSDPYPCNEQLYGSDFFPKDFIYLLKPPNNYYGPYEFFGEDAYPFTIDIDKLDKNDDDDISFSLKRSIINYFVVGAVRYLRGTNNKNNSMLINIDPYTDPQQKIFDQVNKFVRELREKLADDDDIFLKEEVESIWNDILKKTPEIIEKDLKKKNIVSKRKIDFSLDEVIEKTKEYILSKTEDEYLVKIMQVNYKNSDKLIYENGLHVIVIGGFKLSRGLTLSGLTISYFLRKSEQADTQLQSCRWFGYPGDYHDLIRLYTNNQVIELLKSSTAVIKALDEQIERMALANKTPSDFGLFIDKIGRLRATAYNKMRSATKIHKSEESASLMGRDYDIATFYADNSINQENKNILDEFINKISEPNKEQKGAYVWRNIGVNTIIDFIKMLEIHPEARICDKSKLIRHMRREHEKNSLLGMDVALIDISGGDEVYDVGAIKNIHPAKRSGKMNEGEDFFEVNEGRALTVRHLKYGLSEDEIQSVENLSGYKFTDTKTPPSNIISTVRGERKVGLIVIYLFSVEQLNSCETIKEHLNNEIKVPPVGIHISLPGIKESGIAYANKVYMNNKIANIIKTEGIKNV